MEVILAVANSIDPDIQLTLDTPSMNADKKLPCLDLKLWIDSEGLIQFEFYSKPMSSPYLLLQRSAVSRNTKRSTLFQEGMRRVRNCSLDLPWQVVRDHLSKFSWQM